MEQRITNRIIATYPHSNSHQYIKGRIIRTITTIMVGLSIAKQELGDEDLITELEITIIIAEGIRDSHRGTNNNNNRRHRGFHSIKVGMSREGKVVSRSKYN